MTEHVLPPLDQILVEQAMKPFHLSGLNTRQRHRNLERAAQSEEGRAAMLAHITARREEIALLEQYLVKDE